MLRAVPDAALDTINLKDTAATMLGFTRMPRKNLPIVFRRIFDLCTNVESVYMNQGEAAASARPASAQDASHVDASAARSPASPTPGAGVTGEDAAVDEAPITYNYYSPLPFIMYFTLSSSARGCADPRWRGSPVGR